MAHLGAVSGLLERVRADNEAQYGPVRDLLGILLQSFANPWVYTSELLQNAVDAHARKVRFSPQGTDALLIEHDGDAFEEDHVVRLSKAAVRGKDALAVGFMGIGFKSVFRAFQSVDVSSGPWRFGFRLTMQEGPLGVQQPDPLSMVLPLYLPHLPPPSEGMSCRFLLSRRRGGLGLAADDLTHLEAEGFDVLAVLAHKGVEHLEWGRRSWSLQVTRLGAASDGHVVGEGVTATCGGEAPAQHRWLLAASAYTPSTDAARALIAHRNIREERSAVAALRPREVCAFVPVTGNGAILPPEAGQAFALLPTGMALPLHAHLQADWLLDITREGFRDLEDNAWHDAIRDQVPRLLIGLISLAGQRSGELPEWQRVYHVLAGLGSEPQANPVHRWLFAGPFRSSLAALIAEQPVLPARVNAGTVDLYPGHALRLPPPAFADVDKDTLAPWLLWGTGCVSLETVGPEPAEALRALIAVAPLEPAHLVEWWGEKGPERWYKALKPEQRHAGLARLLAAFGSAAIASAVWRNANVPCLPTEAGTWSAATGLVRLPDDWQQVPEDIAKLLGGHAGPPERTVSWDLVRYLNRTAATNPTCAAARALITDATAEVTIPHLAEAWWGTLPEVPPAADVDGIVRLTDWVRRTRRWEAPRLIPKVLGAAATGAVLRPPASLVVAEPYARGYRRQVFRGRLPIARAYYERVAQAQEWTGLWTSLGCGGTFALAKRTASQEVPADGVVCGVALPDLRLTGPVQDSVSGQRLDWRHCAVIDYALPSAWPGPADGHLDRATAEAVAAWMVEGVEDLRRYSAPRVRFVPRYARQAVERAGATKVRWVGQLQGQAWVPVAGGTEVLRPAQVLPGPDPARPDAPVAALAGDLVHVLASAGVQFGTEIPVVTPLYRLEVEGPAAPPERLLHLLTEAISFTRQDGPARQDLITLLQRDEPALLPADPAGRTRRPLWRFVQRAGGSQRGHLAGQLTAIADIRAGTPARQVLDMVVRDLGVAEHATGRQALDVLRWVWAHEPDAGQVAEALPPALRYLAEDLLDDGALRAPLESARPSAKVHVARVGWVSVAAKVYLDDLHLPSGVPLEAFDGKIATPSHLGDSEEDRLRAADLLGLRRLSQVCHVRPQAADIAEAPGIWRERIAALRDLTAAYLDRANASTGVVLLPAPAVHTASALMLQIDIEGQDQPVLVERAALPDGDGITVLRRRPPVIAPDLAATLAALWGLEAHYDLGLVLSTLLAMLDDDGFDELLTARYRGWGLMPPSRALAPHQPKTPGSAEADGDASEAPPRPGADSTDNDRHKVGMNVSLGSAGRPSMSPPRRGPETSGSGSTDGGPHGTSSTHRDPTSGWAAHRVRLHPVGAASGGTHRSDRIYREAAAQFERSQGRYPVLMPDYHPGLDIKSYDRDPSLAGAELVRAIEVKGIGHPWQGRAAVQITPRQFREGVRSSLSQDHDSWWVYVVEKTDAGFHVCRIHNPIARTSGFVLRAMDWRISSEV